VRDPRSLRERQLGAEEERARAARTPAALAGGALGGAAGFALGGPAGAATGAAAGFTGMDSLLNSYAKRVSEGSSMGLGDFVKAAVKGAGSGALANQLLAFGQALSEPSEEIRQEPDKAPVESDEVVSESDEIREMSPDEAVNILKQAGQLDRATIIAQNNPDDVVAKALEATVNRNVNRELHKQFGKSLGEITLTAMPRIREVETKVPEEETKIPEEETKVPDEEVRPLRDVKRVDMGRDLLGETYQSLITPAKATKPLGRVAPFASALKSSNVRGATYDADAQKMRVVFAPKKGRKGGTVYEYDNIDMETFEKMTGGQSRPITEGESEFGIWFNEKDPSVGAAFHKFIKTNADKFPYQKQEPSGFRIDEKQLIEADRTFLGSSLFEPFRQARDRGKQLVKGQALRQLEPALKSMDDEFVADVVAFLEDKLKSKLKTPPKVKRLQKEFQKEFL